MSDADRGVQFAACEAQFEHVAENGDAAAGSAAPPSRSSAARIDAGLAL